MTDNEMTDNEQLHGHPPNQAIGLLGLSDYKATGLCITDNVLKK